MRAPYSPLKWVVEVNASAAPTGSRYWESIAAFDAQAVATRYADACGATGSADLYRVSLRTGLGWTVIHTTGRAAVNAASLHHPQPLKASGKPAAATTP